MKFDDIENAFMFVSMAPKFANSAIFSKVISDNYVLSFFKVPQRATGQVRPNLAVFGRKHL